MEDKIYNEDCLIGLTRLADNSVDFVLSDLPFGITSNAWDKKIDLEKFWEQINRVTKENAAIALFANGKFEFELGYSNLENYRYKIVVEKDTATGFLNAHRMPMKCHEDVLIFYRKLPTYNPQYFYSTPYRRKHAKNNSSKNYRPLADRVTICEDGKRYPRDVICFCYPKYLFGREKEKVQHPTQKPIDLLEYLIRTYSNENEVVLDATIGSGSTAVACINTDRHFIGFEIEEEFYKMALARIEKAQAEKSARLM